MSLIISLLIKSSRSQRHLLVARLDETRETWIIFVGRPLAKSFLKDLVMLFEWGLFNSFICIYVCKLPDISVFEKYVTGNLIWSPQCYELLQLVIPSICSYLKKCLRLIILVNMCFSCLSFICNWVISQ